MLPDYFVRRNFSQPQTIGFPGDPLRCIENVADLFELIQPYARGAGGWWMRGEAQLFPQPCLPKFARDHITFGSADPSVEANGLTLAEPLEQDSMGNSVLVNCLTRQELEIIQDFQRNSPGDEYFDNLVGDDENHPGWFSYAQHYGYSTRMLDVTRDPLVALYFACQPADSRSGRIWLYPHPVSGHGPHPPSTLHDIFEPAISDKDALAWHQQRRLSEYTPQQGVQRGLIEMNFLLDYEAPNTRVVAQRGKFIWAGSPLWSLHQNVIGLEVPAEAKENLLSQVSPFGITADGLCLG